MLKAIMMDMVMTATVAVRMTTARMAMTVMRTTLLGAICTVAPTTMILTGAAVARPNRGKAQQT